jgi:hypothetical protein
MAMTNPDDPLSQKDWSTHNSFSLHAVHGADSREYEGDYQTSETSTDRSSRNEAYFDGVCPRLQGADPIMQGAEMKAESEGGSTGSRAESEAGLTGIRAESEAGLTGMKAGKVGGVKKERRKRAKYMPDTVPLQLPPCRICGKPASGIHYGVNSCEACKVYNRRNSCEFCMI